MFVFIVCAIKWPMHIKKQLLAWKTQFIAFSQMRLKKNKKMRQRRNKYRTQIRINRYVCANWCELCATILAKSIALQKPVNNASVWNQANPWDPPQHGIQDIKNTSNRYIVDTKIYSYRVILYWTIAIPVFSSTNHDPKSVDFNSKLL